MAVMPNTVKFNHIQNICTNIFHSEITIYNSILSLHPLCGEDVLS